jgi:hypothetical protein
VGHGKGEFRFRYVLIQKLGAHRLKGKALEIVVAAQVAEYRPPHAGGIQAAQRPAAAGVGKMADV